MPDSDAQLAVQNRALTRQLLEWVAAAPRTYAEALACWHSSCPRHTIWEDALAQGLVDAPGTGASPLRLTDAGRALLVGRAPA